MRTKTVGRRHRRSSTTPSSVSPIPPLSSTPQDKNQNATVYDTTDDDDDNNNHPASPVPDFVPETEPLDSIDDTVCITCNQPEGSVLVCTETGCPVSVHATCIGSEPKFDGSGNFYCPYCWYKRALNNTKQLREKAIIAKKALSSFLDENKTLRNNQEEEKPAEPVQDPVILDELKVSDSEEGEELSDDDNDKGKVSVTVSSVSETKDSECEAIYVKKKGHAKCKVASSVKKKSLVRERKSGGDDVDEEEVTSSRTVRLQNQNQVKKHTSLTGGKRRRLFWTAEEEKALKEGVLKLSEENHNIPWRKILEFGCRVFDKTRTPADLKDKWKNITSKEGCK